MFLNMFCLWNANFMGKRGKEVEEKILEQRIKDSKEIGDRYNTMSLCHHSNVFEHVLFIKLWEKEGQRYREK